MSPTLYKQPDGHRKGDLVIRRRVKAPLSEHFRDVDRYLEPSEEQFVAREAAQAGQPDVIERASKGERISW